MKAQDPNVAKVELIASALGHLREQLVFVGGCQAVPAAVFTESGCCG